MSEPRTLRPLGLHSRPTSVVEAQRESVRVEIAAGLAHFKGAEICDATRLQMGVAANRIAKRAALRQGIPAPKVVIDRRHDNPLGIEVRIAFEDAAVLPLKGRRK